MCSKAVLLALRSTSILSLKAQFEIVRYCATAAETSGLTDIPPYEPLTQRPITTSRVRGLQLLHDPWYNKGTAFPKTERDRLGLRGLLPPRVLTIEDQKRRWMEEYEFGTHHASPEEVKDSGVTPEMVRKWKLLQALQDRNETLFYKILDDNFVDMAPIVYTPTVGWVCTNYHKLYRRPRGMYFTAEDVGEMAAMVWNWPQDDVHAIVVTDGSRILGLGDLGVNGLGIPIGKLDLYCAAAGFHPQRVLPVVLDVGTNNQKLLDDPLYGGLKHKRITGPAYYAIVDEFVQAVMSRWPKSVLQFEDFSIDHAHALLNRYRNYHLVFNDDIQGTAATALAGLYGALRAMGKPLTALTEQRVLCLGAGSAGMGVVKMIAAGMEKQGMTQEASMRNFWVLDVHGLVSTQRQHLPSHVQPFARPETELEGKSLMEVVEQVRPTVLLGLAGAGRLFTPEIMSRMAALCPSQPPVIFPMSNPISKMECTSDQAIAATDGRCIFASGSPQPPVEYHGRLVRSAQANNMYLFPGVALGAQLGRTGIITEAMLMTAAETLPTLISEDRLAQGLVYPDLSSIREISVKVAAQVIKVAATEGRVQGRALDKVIQGEDALALFIRRNMFVPDYTSMVKLPTGVRFQA